MIFHDSPPKIIEIKPKINKWDLITLIRFFTAKESINKVKRQPSGWNKIITKEKNWWIINFQNMQAAHTTQYQKNKQAHQKVGKRPKQTFLQRPQFSSVQFSLSVVSDFLWPHALQRSRPPCPSPTPRVHSNSCPSSQWCHPAISSSVIPFSSCP